MTKERTAYFKAYREANHRKRSAQSRAHYYKNRETYVARSKNYYKKNREKLLAYAHEYYEAHREEIAENRARRIRLGGAHLGMAGMTRRQREKFQKELTDGKTE